MISCYLKNNILVKTFLSLSYADTTSPSPKVCSVQFCSYAEGSFVCNIGKFLRIWKQRAASTVEITCDCPEIITNFLIKDSVLIFSIWTFTSQDFFMWKKRLLSKQSLNLNKTLKRLITVIFLLFIQKV